MQTGLRRGASFTEVAQGRYYLLLAAFDEKTLSRQAPPGDRACQLGHQITAIFSGQVGRAFWERLDGHNAPDAALIMAGFQPFDILLLEIAWNRGIILDDLAVHI